MRKRQEPVAADDDRMPKRGEHATVHLATGGLEADVDCGIAPLVREAWKAGVVTRQCCEADAEGLVWIQFETLADLIHFLGIAAGNDFRHGSLYDRSLYGYDRVVYPVLDQWRYEVVVHDFEVEEIEIRKGAWKMVRLGPPMFEAYVSVRFPRSDIGAVLRRLKKHNRTLRDEARRRPSD